MKVEDRSCGAPTGADSEDRGGWTSLAAVGQVDSRRVARLGLLLGGVSLLPLILLWVARHQAGLAEQGWGAVLSSEIAWGATVVSLVLGLAAALAYFITRQRALVQGLDQAVHSLPAPFVYLEAGGRVCFHNRACLEAYAPRTQDIHGRPLAEVLDAALYVQMEGPLAQAFGGQRTEFGLRVEHGGPASELHVICVPHRGAGGRVKGVFLLARDMTDRRRAERCEEARLPELARFSRLAGIGEIAAEIAHQVNQPLAAIAMFSSASQRALAGGGDQAQVSGWLATINAQAKRASETIATLRRYVRPGSHEPGILAINELLEQVAALLGHDAASRHVEFSLDLAPDLPPVRASAILVEQVVFQWAHKAILATATRGGPGKVTLRSRARGGRVWVEVHQDGPGGEAEGPGDQAMPAGLRPGPDGDLELDVHRAIIAGFGGEMGRRCDDGGGTVCFFHLPGDEQ